MPTIIRTMINNDLYFLVYKDKHLSEYIYLKKQVLNFVSGFYVHSCDGDVFLFLARRREIIAIMIMQGTKKSRHRTLIIIYTVTGV